MLYFLFEKYPQSKIFAMLRPHGKISYRISDTDLETIITDMESLKENGIDGFVFGALTPNRDIDVEKCQNVIENANGLPVTFHRAFDMTLPSKKLDNVDKIVSCGFTRILTSGFAETAEFGIDALTEIQRYITENSINLILMPGCGITIRNAEKILRISECREFHASCKTKVVEDIPRFDEDTAAISKEIDKNEHSLTDIVIVRKLVAIGKLCF